MSERDWEYDARIREDAARAERERIRGELTREAVENVNGVYVVGLRHVERICGAPADAPDWRDVARRLLKVALDAGVWQTAPCPICGYNGPGYFQADAHPCSHGDVDAVLARRGGARERGGGMTKTETTKWLREAVELAHRRTVRIDREGDWICWECEGYWRYYDPPNHAATCRLAAIERAAGFDPRAARPGSGQNDNRHFLSPRDVAALARGEGR